MVPFPVVKFSRSIWLLVFALCLSAPVVTLFEPRDHAEVEGIALPELAAPAAAPAPSDPGLIKQRVTPLGNGWLVESLQETGDPQMPILHVREEYSGPVVAANLINHHAWCADRLVLSTATTWESISREAEARLLDLGFTLYRAYPFSPVRVYLLPEVSLDAAQQWKTELESLLGESGLSIGRDHILYPVSTTPDDPRFAEQWALGHIRAPEAWDFTTGSAEAIVAVLDTGLQLSHEDFHDGPESNLWLNPEDPPDGIDNDGNGFTDDLHGWDFVNESGTVIEDTSGHGTEVSGILGARGNNGTGISGIAWNMKILPMRAGEVSFPNSVLAQAMDYVTDLRLRGHPVVATSNSYGYYPSEDPTPEEWAATEVLALAIERARQAGILVITASGNGGQNNDSQYVRHFFPSDAPHHNVISVNALDASGALWRGSNYGPESVDLAAPGLNILTTDNSGGYSSRSGTSMAAPHVSGAAALLASLQPDLNTSWMRALILGSAVAHPSMEGKITTGGALDLAAMLELASLPRDEAWKRFYWSDPELAAMEFSWDDSSDGDPWSHLMELAFGGNPRRADSRPAFRIEQAASQPGQSGDDALLVTLEYEWSPLADGLVTRQFEHARDSNGPWLPAIPVSHFHLRDDPFTGLRTYQASFIFPHSPALIRLRLEPGPLDYLRSWGRAELPLEAASSYSK